MWCYVASVNQAFNKYLLLQTCSSFVRCLNIFFVRSTDNKLSCGSLILISVPEALVCTHCKTKEKYIINVDLKQVDSFMAVSKNSMKQPYFLQIELRFVLAEQFNMYIL